MNHHLLIMNLCSDRSRGVIPGSFQGRSGVIPGSFRDHSGVIPGSLWGHSGIILGSFWDILGIILRSFCHHFGIILGSLWDYFGVSLGSLWDHTGIIFWECGGGVTKQFCFVFVLVCFTGGSLHNPPKDPPPTPYDQTRKQT